MLRSKYGTKVLIDALLISFSLLTEKKAYTGIEGIWTARKKQREQKVKRESENPEPTKLAQAISSDDTMKDLLSIYGIVIDIAWEHE